MRISSRNSRKHINFMTDEMKAALDAEGKTIIEAFATNMKTGVAVEDESNMNLLQQHFDWAKKSITKNKVEYLKIVKMYSTDPKQIQAFNSVAQGLPRYIKSVALTYISKIK